MNRLASAAGYAEHAAALAEQYEGIPFEALHRDVLHLFPTEPGMVLDIGAGSGRDAAAMARRGHRVVAIEPTEALRREGQRIHADVPIEWIDDALPALATLCASGRVFDLVLLTAVWMHLDLQERAQAMQTVANLLSAGGIVTMSLRHGPVPAGRRMYEVSADETIALGRGHGLEPVHYSERDDAQGRTDVSWSFVALRKPYPHTLR
ncbi:class I SAM-dependent methyltransferase [Trinickia fusca]|uniref:Class I SAM-dependent methyltransferase n=1 Tax=Trinickia fusca TaxID=2419777 RepID=A0A494XNT3_9BURK|nr:class I SAM-dependent methyltransferase [Trinickia fusca]RKP50406.1 class I SAM-dependent methyltransferase [Trinickia fusca]